MGRTVQPRNRQRSVHDKNKLECRDKRDIVAEKERWLRFQLDMFVRNRIEEQTSVPADHQLLNFTELSNFSNSSTNGPGLNDRDLKKSSSKSTKSDKFDEDSKWKDDCSDSGGDSDTESGEETSLASSESWLTKSLMAKILSGEKAKNRNCSPANDTVETSNNTKDFTSRKNVKFLSLTLGLLIHSNFNYVQEIRSTGRVPIDMPRDLLEEDRAIEQAAIENVAGYATQGTWRD